MYANSAYRDEMPHQAFHTLVKHESHWNRLGLEFDMRQISL